MNTQRDDQCDIQQRGEDSDTKLKYLTTNFVDLQDAQETSNFFSLGFRNGVFAPTENTDTESALMRADVTNQRAKTGFGALPLPTMPGKYQQNAYGDPEVEKDIRGIYTTRDRALWHYNNMDYMRTFPIFPDGSVYDNMGNFVEDATVKRGGESSRNFKNLKK